ncbi:MAG: tetratricopeptide repeat protein [Chthoniobacterales bacterium]
MKLRMAVLGFGGLLFSIAAHGSLEAQTILLKNGQQVETRGVTRSGDKVMAKIDVGGTAGQAGYDISGIARIQFPEPRGLRAGAELLSQGQPEKALAELTPIINFYAPFKDIPGAWWSAAAVTKVSALAALQRDAEAQTLAQEIQKNTSDPEIARAANLRIAAALVEKLEFEKAAEICDAAIKESTRPDVLADAWVTKGNLLLAQKEWDSALLAFLRVPVFYEGEKLHMPPALLGSARAYRRLDDLERAKKSLNDLIAAFPKSAEAALAQAELRKLPK